jgi:type IX secretion system PorP/SprF family membrane protein
MNKYLLIILLTLGLISTEAYAQQKPVFSQYYFNPLAINPAFAGSQQDFNATLLYRHQWVNVEGAPRLITASANTGIRNKRIGLGFIMSNERIGVHSDFSLYLSYAYQIRFRDGAFSMGIQGGFTQLKSDFTQLTLLHINDPNLSGIMSRLNPNFGAGLLYEKNKFYAGFSIPYMLNNKLTKDGDIQLSEARTRRYYFLVVGKLFELSPRIQIRPEAVIRLQEQAPFGFDANFKFILDQRIGLGVIYRSGDAIIGTFEFQLNQNLRIGYAYEWTTTALNQFSRGTHEFMLSYRLKIRGLNRPDYCATYF